MVEKSPNLVALQFELTTPVLFCRYSWLRLLFVVPEIVLATLLSIVAENLAVLVMDGSRFKGYLHRSDRSP
jgi:hypothetical protein